MPSNGETAILVLHPGFAKTATTSLQRQVFFQHSGLAYLGLPAVDKETEWAIRQICQTDTVYYDQEKVRSILQIFMESASPNKTIVLSDENLTLYESKDKGMVGERLYNLFPGARILFTLRRQEDLLCAWYLQKSFKYIKHGHYIDFDTWMNMKLKEPHKSIFDDLNFFKTIDYYANLFGRGNICISLFEELMGNPEDFSKMIAAFMNIDHEEFFRLLSEKVENPTISRNLLAFGRYWAPRMPQFLARQIAKHLRDRGGVPARVDIGDETRRLVRQLCAEGNKRLETTYGVDLAAYGYTLPKD